MYGLMLRLFVSLVMDFFYVSFICCLLIYLLMWVLYVICWFILLMLRVGSCLVFVLVVLMRFSGINNFFILRIVLFGIIFYKIWWKLLDNFFFCIDKDCWCGVKRVGCFVVFIMFIRWVMMFWIYSFIVFLLVFSRIFGLLGVS